MWSQAAEDQGLASSGVFEAPTCHVPTSPMTHGKLQLEFSLPTLLLTLTKIVQVKGKVLLSVLGTTETESNARQDFPEWHNTGLPLEKWKFQCFLGVEDANNNYA